MLRRRVSTLDLLVLRDREESFSTRLLCRHQRNEKARVLAITETFVEGIPPGTSQNPVQHLIRGVRSTTEERPRYDRSCRRRKELAAKKSSPFLIHVFQREIFPGQGH